MGILWAFLMLVWLAGLVSGFGRVWPHVTRMALTADLVIGLMWLIIGAAAWVVALNFGLQRYWRPGRRPGRS
jgi:hypothetical protein